MYGTGIFFPAQYKHHYMSLNLLKISLVTFLVLKQLGALIVAL